MGADPASMELLRYIDVLVVFFLAVFLALGIVLVRSERHVFKLMTTESKKQRDGDEGVRVPSTQLGSFRRRSSTTAAGMVTMEWDDLSWDEKTAIARRQKILNWASAACGACGLIGALWMGYATLHGIETFLGTFGIVVVGLGFLCMGGYLVWNHLQLWRESASDVEVQMEGTRKDRDFHQLVLIFVIALLFGGTFFQLPGIAAAVVITAAVALLQSRRRRESQAQAKDDEE